MLNLLVARMRIGQKFESEKLRKEKGSLQKERRATKVTENWEWKLKHTVGSNCATSSVEAGCRIAEAQRNV
jgi:hypothetical protein